MAVTVSLPYRDWPLRPDEINQEATQPGPRCLRNCSRCRWPKRATLSLVNKRCEFFTLLESKVVKNRLHLDLSADDPTAEIARLTELGAMVMAVRSRWTVLADPDGNEFCVSRR